MDACWVDSKAADSDLPWAGVMVVWWAGSMAAVKDKRTVVAKAQWKVD